MIQQEVIGLFERLGRLSNAARETKGEGSAWTYTFPDSETHRYVVSGLKSLEEMDDAIKNLLMWIWSAKDYLKQWAQAHGKSGQSVEQEVNKRPDLRICADLANLSKHATLKQSRSGLFPTFGKLSRSIAAEALESITFREREVETQVADPSLVTVTLPVFDQNNNEIGDAFEYALRGITDLEKIRERIEK